METGWGEGDGLGGWGGLGDVDGLGDGDGFGGDRFAERWVGGGRGVAADGEGRRKQIYIAKGREGTGGRGSEGKVEEGERRRGEGSVG